MAKKPSRKVTRNIERKIERRKARKAKEGIVDGGSAPLVTLPELVRKQRIRERAMMLADLEAAFHRVQGFVASCYDRLQDSNPPAPLGEIQHMRDCVSYLVGQYGSEDTPYAIRALLVYDTGLAQLLDYIEDTISGRVGDIYGEWPFDRYAV